MSEENTGGEAEVTSGEENTGGEAEGTGGEGGENEPLLKALHSERATVKELKAQLAELAKAQEKIKLESLSESERAIAEAKKAGYEEAMASVRGDLTRSKVTATAAAANFADPADAAGFLNLDELDGDDDIAKAVAELAKSKPYLLKRNAQSLEQGQQGKQKQNDPNDWLRGALSR